MVGKVEKGEKEHGWDDAEVCFCLWLQSKASMPDCGVLTRTYKGSTDGFSLCYVVDMGWPVGIQTDVNS